MSAREGPQTSPPSERGAGDTKERGFVRRVSDPAVMGLLVGTLYFAGWTYYDAYFLRLGLNPAGFGFASIAVGVKGASAMLITLAALLGGIFTILVATLLIVVGAIVLRRCGLGRWRKGAHPEPDQISPVVMLAVSITFAVVVVLGAGPYAGRINARDELALVDRGGGWDYHLRREVVRGVPIMQNDERIWLLTRVGIRPIKTDDVLLQNGPLFENAKAER